MTYHAVYVEDTSNVRLRRRRHLMSNSRLRRGMESRIVERLRGLRRGRRAQPHQGYSRDPSAHKERVARCVSSPAGLARPLALRPWERHSASLKGPRP